MNEKLSCLAWADIDKLKLWSFTETSFLVCLFLIPSKSLYASLVCNQNLVTSPLDITCLFYFSNFHTPIAVTRDRSKKYPTPAPNQYNVGRLSNVFVNVFDMTNHNSDRFLLPVPVSRNSNLELCFETRSSFQKCLEVLRTIFCMQPQLFEYAVNVRSVVWVDESLHHWVNHN